MGAISRWNYYFLLYCNGISNLDATPPFLFDFFVCIGCAPLLTAGVYIYQLRQWLSYSFAFRLHFTLYSLQSGEPVRLYLFLNGIQYVGRRQNGDVAFVFVSFSSLPNRLTCLPFYSLVLVLKASLFRLYSLMLGGDTYWWHRRRDFALPNVTCAYTGGGRRGQRQAFSLLTWRFPILCMSESSFPSFSRAHRLVFINPYLFYHHRDAVIEGESLKILRQLPSLLSLLPYRSLRFLRGVVPTTSSPTLHTSSLTLY